MIKAGITFFVGWIVQSKRGSAKVLNRICRLAGDFQEFIILWNDINQGAICLRQGGYWFTQNIMWGRSLITGCVN